MAAVRRFIPHFAVTFARGLALVHHRIAGDECSGGRDAAKWGWKRRIAVKAAVGGKMRVTSNGWTVSAQGSQRRAADCMLQGRNAGRTSGTSRSRPTTYIRPSVDQRAPSGFDVITNEPSIDKITPGHEQATRDHSPDCARHATPLEPDRPVTLARRLRGLFHPAQPPLREDRAGLGNLDRGIGGISA